MHGRNITKWVFLGLLLGALSHGSAQEAKPEEVEAFPEVELSEASSPRYGVIPIDVWHPARVAYLLFDGNVNEGYKRMYVWIPGDRKYGRPVAMNANSDNQFRSLEFESRNEISGRGGMQALVKYNFSYRRRTHSGLHRYFDYAKGEWVERGSGKVTHSPRFDFLCDFMVAPRTGAAMTSGRAALDLGIYGSLGSSTTWEELPKVSRPWEELRIYMTRIATREGRRAVVRFQARLQYHSVDGWRNVDVRSLAEETEISLVIRPYMEEPVFEGVLSFEEAFGEGKPVDLPFGWYEYEWDMSSPGIKVLPRRDEHVTLVPQPLGPDDFE